MIQAVRNNKNTILVGEDDLELRTYLEIALRCQGFSVQSVQDGEEVLNYLQEGRPVSAVLLDLVMPRKDGIDTLRGIRKTHKELPVIMLSGESSPLNIVEAMKNGATDFLTKPVNHDDLGQTVRKFIDMNVETEPEPAAPPVYSRNGGAYFGMNPKMREIQALAARVGASDAPVLIQGETGSGKEVLARELHARSPRSHMPFVKLNCAALPSELVESELFGYERGAFTGAFQRKPGMFEIAEGGTLLLDEIGDMDFSLQAKLLQVLQDHEFQRLGGKETIRVNVRVIAATHQNLDTAILESRFREDLYYRLAVVTLRIPPLRERKEDIMTLAESFVQKYNPAGVPRPPIINEMRQAFLTYDWPGNVRELENIIRRYVILREPGMILQDLAAMRTRFLTGRISAESNGTEVAAEPILEQVTKAKEEAETKAILAALQAARWNRKQAAVALKIDYKALLYKMKKLSIEERAAV